jgi:hypothetical protein
MDTIGRSAFGTLTNVQRNPNDPFLLAAKAFFQVNIRSVVNSLLLANICFPELTWLLYPLRRAQSAIMDMFNLSHNGLLYNVCGKIVEARDKNISRSITPWSRHDLLQQMMEAKMSHEQMQTKQGENLTISTDMRHGGDEVPEARTDSKGGKNLKYMTREEVVANAVLFFEAGYETTSTTLGFVAHILINYPDVQERVREEVQQLQDKEGRLDYNTVTELPYLEAVLFETMRVYPPITLFVTRVSETDYRYKDMTIPKGAGIIVPVYQLHHDPELWEEPEKFDPMRFYGTNKGKINPVIWQPFGSGPRNCIGMRFALLEAKLALAQLLLKYRLEPGPSSELGDITVDYKVIGMTPKKGVFLRAIPL